MVLVVASRDAALQDFVGCDARLNSQLLSCPRVFKRINKALLAHAITYLRNTKDLFKMTNALDHTQAPSACGTDQPETRRRNQSGYPSNAPIEDATNERVGYAPIPSDIAS